MMYYMLAVANHELLYITHYDLFMFIHVLLVIMHALLAGYWLLASMYNFPYIVYCTISTIDNFVLTTPY